MATLFITLTAATAAAQPSVTYTTYPGVTGLFGSHIFFANGMSAGPDGALWVSALSSTSSEIWRVTTAGAITEYPISNAPGTIAAGPDGALWFTERSARQIGRITTGGAITEYSIPCCAKPAGIVAGPDGALWFTENDGDDKIGRITTTGAVIEYPLPGPNFFAIGITAGPDGALWFSDVCGPGADKIGRITTAGVITEYDLPGSCRSITGPVTGPDGALWYLVGLPGAVGRITTAGSITEYPLPSGSFPFNIVAGPDGALWFLVTDPDGFSPPVLGRMTTAGAYTPYNLPTPLNAGGSVMALGPDNALWITDGATIVRAAVGTCSGDCSKGSRLSITTTALPAGVAGTPYSATLTASGGNPPYNWSIISGSLPAGLFLNPATGVISGVPSGPGTSFTVVVGDSSIPLQSATQALSIAITSPGSTFSIASSPTGLAITVDGVSYATPHTFACDPGSQHALMASSPQFVGIPGFRFVFTGWSDGVSTATRQITCSSTATTYTANFKIQYLLAVTVAPAGAGSVAVNPSSPDGFYDSGALVVLTASSGFASWSGDLSGTANPQSLVMDSAKSVTANFTTGSTFSIASTPAGLAITVDGVLYATPHTFACDPGSQHTLMASSPQFVGIPGFRYVFTGWSDGVSAATRQVTCSSTAATYTANFKIQYLLSVTIMPAGAGSVVVSPSSPDGFYDSGASVVLTASSGFVSWSGGLSGSDNPQSLVMNGAKSVTANFVTGSALTIVTTSLPSGAGGTPYSATLVASGGTLPYTWSIISGSLPAGLSLNPATGVISGVPTGSGTSFTVRVFDSSIPAQSATKALSIAISNGIFKPGSTFSIDSSPTGLAIAVDGVSYSTPHTFTCDVGTQHTLVAISPQSNPIGSGTYSFAGWSDGTPTASRQIMCLASSAAYTANFGLQFVILAQ